MSNDAIAIAGFVALFVLMMLRVPVGMAMGLVGVTGYSWIVGPGPALKLVGLTSMRTVTDYTFGVIPMFMLMGAFVSVSGLSREMFKAADAFLGHRRGGLPRDAALRLSAVVFDRRDRRRRYASVRCCRRRPCWRSTRS